MSVQFMLKLVPKSTEQTKATVQVLAQAKKPVPSKLPMIISNADSRADNNLRDVILSTQQVVIRRQVSGLEMRLAVPLKHYNGVLLTVLSETQFMITIDHKDKDLSVMLLRVSDLTALAEWRLWASLLNLPLILQNEDGSTRNIYSTLGALTVGEVSEHRRGFSTITKRRPRHYMRKKMFSNRESHCQNQARIAV
jgi:Family of unknown function (DUF6101)